MDKLSSKTGMLFTKKPKTSNYVEFHYIEEFSEMVNSNCTEQPQNHTKQIGTMCGSNAWGLSMVGSCNGLVCYRVAESQFGRVIYIFNPMTDERIVFRRAGMCFNSVGFGYCDSTNAYKVVRNCYMENGVPCAKNKFQVYTLGVDNDWRDKPQITYEFEESGVFANGALHWLNNKSSCEIVAFDLADETFQSLPSPPVRHFPSESYINVTLEGTLCLCLPDEEMDHVWVFKKKNINNCGSSTCLKTRTYSNSFTWIKVFSRKLDSGGSRYQVLSLTENKILISQDGVISCYDIEASTPKRLWRTEVAKGYDQATPHMNNSLVSLEDFGEPLVDREESPPEKLPWIPKAFSDFGGKYA